jgi:hypothetical protein
MGVVHRVAEWIANHGFEGLTVHLPRLPPEQERIRL